ncbi:MAG: glycoside hydrolase family 5 protein [Puniceicoccales bacterium]|jgi:hypothetical protein|nr:glycoside hydrolase family 5 protein [Puniceicoccales bacterium]
MRGYFLAFLLFALVPAELFGSPATENKMQFWANSKMGANSFRAEPITREDLIAAKGYGIEFLRLAFDKFPSNERDFLIGDADDYKCLCSADLQRIKEMLRLCEEENMPVIITMLSLPGSRWAQNNGGTDDLRLWQNTAFQEQAAKFWTDLAVQLRDCPILVGYNILNEPHPERVHDKRSTHVESLNQKEMQKQLFVFNQLIINAIRRVDESTPIIIDSSAYADPGPFGELVPMDDGNVLYAFHMFEPYEYTNHKYNTGKYVYPGWVRRKYWDKKALKIYMDPVRQFQKRHRIPSHRILVEEFGGYRRQKGLPKYFKDLRSIFAENGWHSAFYAFRDDWDGMDYELGDQRLPWEYWKAEECGEKYPLERRGDTPQFSALIENVEL